jgi:hypothetical protein
MIFIIMLFSCVIMQSVVRLSVEMLTAMAHCQEQTDTLAYFLGVSVTLVQC